MNHPVAYARAILKKKKLYPNKQELQLLNLLERFLPNSFIFNDGRFLIDGKIPDFIYVKPDKKLLIELIGAQHYKAHTEKELEKKESIYKEYGFRTLFIYSKELRDPYSIISDILTWIDQKE